MAEQTSDSKPLQPSRRGLVVSLLALPFVAGSMLWGRRDKRNGRRPEPANALDRHDQQLTVADAKSRGQKLLATYPQPRWLPADFKLQSTTACSEAVGQRGAFLNVEDSKQLCFSAVRASARSHGEFINSGLSVFVAPLATMPQVRGKAQQTVPLVITVGDGERVEAHYYESHENRAAFAAAHCLAFHRNGFGVVVSSFHKNRLTRTDLERVAAQIS
ncbi:MAG TPA: hypothetical protein VN700_09430 [Vicinamibacterales bacterium]|nr:hypothetical protein [Vicinamibacterales bacterium]